MEWIDSLGGGAAAFLGAVIGAPIGALFGALGSYFVGVVLASREDRQRKEVLLKSLYSEIYNRVARCALDTTTWRRYVQQGVKTIEPTRLQKFRPTDLLVLNSLGADIAILGESVLSPLLMFHYRLDAIRRDIDADPNRRLVNPGEVRQFEWNRLEQTLAPGLSLLKALEAAIADKQAFKVLSVELEDAHNEWIESIISKALPKELKDRGTLQETVEGLIETQADFRLQEN